ncbi:MAG: hypothetical protein BGN88_02210 [Clostridiales bacterium 43-6]|nr:MAG: hypothetical protein BGN88_02210 [Clostridiales bacterium 43-6]
MTKYFKPMYVVLIILFILIVATVGLFLFLNRDIKVHYSVSYDMQRIKSEASNFGALDCEFTNLSARCDDNYFFLENNKLISVNGESKNVIADDISEINGISRTWIYATTKSYDPIKPKLLRISYAGKEKEVIFSSIEKGSIYNPTTNSVYYVSNIKPLSFSCMNLITKRTVVVFYDRGKMVADKLEYAHEYTFFFDSTKINLQLQYGSEKAKNRNVIFNDSGVIFSDKLFD